MQSAESEPVQSEVSTDILRAAIEHDEIESDVERANFMEMLKKQEACDTQDKIKETGLNPSEILASCKFETAITTEQEKLNEEITILSSNLKSVEIFLCEIHSGIRKKFEELVKASNIENKSLAMFYKSFHEFMKSEQYNHQVQQLFLTSDVSQTQYHLAYGIVEKIRSHIVEDDTKMIKSSAVENSRATTNTSTFEDSPTGSAMQRYIAGLVVSSLKKQKMKTNLHEATSTQTVKAYHKQMEILETFTALSENTDPDQASMREINCKNNVRESLCDVTDKAFSFFIKIDKAVRKLETKKNIGIYGPNLYNFICDSVKNDTSLQSLWKDLLLPEVDVECAESLRKEIISKYVKMSCVQFRKKYKRTLGIKKKEAYSTEIKLNHPREEGIVPADKGQMREVTHATSDASTTGPLKALQSKRQKRKQPPTGKSKGKGKKIQSVNYPCGKCFRECTNMCVCCDSCDIWYHYRCLGITRDDAALQKEHWFCPTCL